MTTANISHIIDDFIAISALRVIYEIRLGAPPSLFAHSNRLRKKKPLNTFYHQSKRKQKRQTNERERDVEKKRVQRNVEISARWAKSSRGITLKCVRTWSRYKKKMRLLIYIDSISNSFALFFVYLFSFHMQSNW